MKFRILLILAVFSFGFLRPVMAAKYVILAWNDLGMHCYNRDFRDLAVLPPYNTLWAQVIEVADPPRIVVMPVIMMEVWKKLRQGGSKPISSRCMIENTAMSILLGILAC